jgi:hypothetical protein
VSTHFRVRHNFLHLEQLERFFGLGADFGPWNSFLRLEQFFRFGADFSPWSRFYLVEQIFSFGAGGADFQVWSRWSSR